MKAAQDGLLPDKREAALVVYKENKNVNGQWIERKVVQYLPMGIWSAEEKSCSRAKSPTSSRTSCTGARSRKATSSTKKAPRPSFATSRSLDLTEEQAADSNIVVAYSIATYKGRQQVIRGDAPLRGR
jgi:recombination protein RecT